MNKKIYAESNVDGKDVDFILQFAVVEARARRLIFTIAAHS